MPRTKTPTPSRSKKSGRVKTVIKTILLAGVLMVAFGVFYTATVVSHAPAIDTTDLYAYMSESSTLYDDQGNIIDNVFDAGGNRINLSYDEMPKDLINAVVAIEDKTFWEHHGFNIIRIFGAIKESLFSGGSISGTSTITQQLARNVYLADTKSVRSLNRKVTEAWYTVILERNLSKEQIVEAYLNTIYLGFNCYGVESASKAYFNKSAKDLNLVECVALAAIPKYPDAYAPLLTYTAADFAEKADTINPEYILAQNADYTTVYNGEASKDRRSTILSFMEEQGYITSAEKEEAAATDLFSEIELSPAKSTGESYFTSFVIDQVIEDLMEDGYSRENARALVYTGGLHIYTTLNAQAQNAVETQFEDPENFPAVAYWENTIDDEGNIYNKDGTAILLYSMDSMLANNQFVFREDEYRWNKDGSVTLMKNKRLNFFNTVSNSTKDITIEFKPMYTITDAFYSLQSCPINIPSTYKSYDDDGNVVVSAEFFKDYPDNFTTTDGALIVHENGYRLNQKIRQPQAAMVICDNKTGAVKAMVGGRNVTGELLYNRAVNPRQTGSSIKPLSVYSSALQIGADAAKSDTPLTYGEFDANQRTSGYGNYWTAASRINDAKMVVDGRVWPENVYQGYRGMITMRRAVEISCNVAAVRVFQQVGAAYAANQLEKFGITTIVRDGSANDMNPAALALGGQTVGVSPLEMASAYTTFPALGVHHAYSCYTEVKNSHDETILLAEPESTKVLDEGVAFITADILRTVVAQGGGTDAATWNQVAAGKTGTTSDQYDVWFCGFTPQYSAALWIGNDVNLELNDNSTAAARLWGIIMSYATEGMTGDFVSKPDSVIQKNGEYFVSGTETGTSSPPTTPKQTEESEVLVEACADSGYIATPWCTNRTTITYKESDAHANYYCPVHNKDSGSYPVADGEQVPATTPDPVQEEEDAPADNNAAGDGDNNAQEAAP